MDIYEQAIEAYEQANGNKSEAARILGISRSALRDRLTAYWNRDVTNAKQRELRQASMGPSKASLEKKYQAKIDELEEALRVARKPRAKLELKAHRRQKGDFRRFIIPDTHGSSADKPALKAALSDLASLDPAEIVMLGDHIDCGGFLAQHHTLGYVAELEASFEEDVAAANGLLDQIQSIAPKAKIHFIEGNHERRIEKWIVTQCLKHPGARDALMNRFSVEHFLSLSSRGIHHYRQGHFYSGLPVPSTIKLGKCYFAHGYRTGQHAASQHLKDFGNNIVYGHTHRADSYVMRSVEHGTIGAWCPGCLSVLQPMWRHDSPTNWSHGYGLQLCRSSGEFLHVNVPIINGNSLLMPLIG